MMFLDQQLHGYRNGHQLLSSTTKLSKADQDLVDRLSDIAGPLRPGERFASYLTAYPLPSGSYYVVAMTWQDLDAPRTGCVRTRSLIIPIKEWSRGVDIPRLLKILAIQGPTNTAEPIEAPDLQSTMQLPIVSAAENVELIEALFLEERKPVAVFGATAAEDIIVRLLAAIWPSFRRNISVSTFALSPRSIAGRSFDLVFAPIDARPRFSDWPGRRIDAKKPIAPRHRWTSEILDRVFGDEFPSLLKDDALGELASEAGGTESELRISLLWNELQGKVKSSPNAVLGLLDIANSRSVRNVDAIKKIEPELARSANRAVTTLPPSEGWRFLLALTDKLKDLRLSLSLAKSIRGAAIELANESPESAIANVKMLYAANSHEMLLGSLGDGLAQNFSNERAAMLAELPALLLLEILLLSPNLADVTLSYYTIIVNRLTDALDVATEEKIEQSKRRLLRLLVSDEHANAAKRLIAKLSFEELCSEAHALYNANGLASDSLIQALVERADMLASITQFREIAVEIPVGRGSDTLLLRLLSPTSEDLQWLLETSNLVPSRRVTLIRRVLHSASDNAFRAVVAGPFGEKAIQLLGQEPIGNIEIIDRALETKQLSATTAIRMTIDLLGSVDEYRARQLASRGLAMILPRTTDDNRAADLAQLLSFVGKDLNGSWALRVGLQRNVPSRVATENLIAFNRCEDIVRRSIVAAVEELASAIVARGRIDLGEDASAHAAALLWDAGIQHRETLKRASDVLLPFLLKRFSEPASALIAATFPVVYQHLNEKGPAPDFFMFFIFVGWDKRKAARQELVDAFMRSNWPLTDLALAAARSGDISKILGLVHSHTHGSQVLATISQNIGAIPAPWQDQTRKALSGMLRKQQKDKYPRK